MKKNVIKTQFKIHKFVIYLKSTKVKVLKKNSEFFQLRKS